MKYLFSFLFLFGCSAETAHEANARRWAADRSLGPSHISCGGPERDGYALCTFYVGGTVQIFECTRHSEATAAAACREPTFR
jgi:hypothetical protein